MRRHLSAFFAGALFAVGLAISGMTQPGKVIGFLDVLGDWDPSLAFVMGGAVIVNVALFRLARRRSKPLFEPRFHLPTRRDIDGRLIVGGVLFGVGWGLSGYCPGPALVSTATAGAGVLAFVGAMAAGVGLHAALTRARRRAPQRRPEPAE